MGLIGFHRNGEDIIESIVSDSPELKSERFLRPDGYSAIFFGGWNSARTVKVVPLAVEKPTIFSAKHSEDYQRLPDEIRAIFDDDKILRTSPTEESYFSALMYVLDSKLPEGRTGVLLYRGNPVTVNIDGKEFVVEVKGVGVPNGDNTIGDPMSRDSYFDQGAARYGGLEVSQGEREFRNLEILRNEAAKTFTDGNSPRVALVLRYDGKVKYFGDGTEQAYLLRLSPSSIRASFDGNGSLPEVRSKSNRIARDLAQQYVELMSLDSILIHTCAHSENLVLTNDGFKFTDYSDMRKLAELEEPHRIVQLAFTDFVDEIPNRTDEDIADYCRVLCEGLGIEWNEQYKNPKELAEEIWKFFIAPRVYELRRSGINAVRDKTLKIVNEWILSPEELDKEIVESAQRQIGYRQWEVERYQGLVAVHEKWISKLGPARKDIVVARRMYAGNDYIASLDDQEVLELVEKEYEKRIERDLPEDRENLNATLRTIQALEQNAGNSHKLAEIEPEVLSGLRLGLQTIRKYLSNEIDLVRAVRTEVASIMVANDNIAEIDKVLIENRYSVVDKLREDAGYVLRLMDLPYLNSV